MPGNLQYDVYPDALQVATVQMGGLHLQLSSTVPSNVTIGHLQNFDYLSILLRLEVVSPDWSFTPTELASPQAITVEITTDYARGFLTGLGQIPTLDHMPGAHILIGGGTFVYPGGSTEVGELNTLFLATDARLRLVPEPGSAISSLSALIGFASLIWRKAAKSRASHALA